MILILVNSSHCHNRLFPLAPVGFTKENRVHGVFQYDCLFPDPLREKIHTAPGLKNDAVCKIKQIPGKKPEQTIIVFFPGLAPDRYRYRNPHPQGGKDRHDIVLTDKGYDHIRLFFLPDPPKLPEACQEIPDSPALKLTRIRL